MANRTLRCVVVTPEKAVIDTPADYVSLPLFDGQSGFLPGRAPLVGRMNREAWSFDQQVRNKLFMSRVVLFR